MNLNPAMWLKALQVIPHVTQEEWARLDVISKWLISSRAAVLIMTTISGAIAGILAYQQGSFNFWLWLLVEIGLVFAHRPTTCSMITPIMSKVLTRITTTAASMDPSRWSTG